MTRSESITVTIKAPKSDMGMEKIAPFTPKNAGKIRIVGMLRAISFKNVRVIDIVGPVLVAEPKGKGCPAYITR